MHQPVATPTPMISFHSAASMAQPLSRSSKSRAFRVKLAGSPRDHVDNHGRATSASTAATEEQCEEADEDALFTPRSASPVQDFPSAASSLSPASSSASHVSSSSTLSLSLSLFSRSPPRLCQRRVALCVTPLDIDELIEAPHTHLFQHLSLTPLTQSPSNAQSFSLPSPRHKSFLLTSLLSTHPFFATLNKSVKKLIFNDMVREVFAQGAVLQRASTLVDKFHVIELGSVAVTRIDEDGVDSNRIVSRGQTFGDLSLYHPSQSATIIAVSSSSAVLWTIDGSLIRFHLCSDAQNRHAQLSEFLNQFTFDDGASLSNAEKLALMDVCEVKQFEQHDTFTVTPQQVLVVKEGQLKARHTSHSSEATMDDDAAPLIIGAGAVVCIDPSSLLPPAPLPLPQPLSISFSAGHELPRHPSPIPVMPAARSRKRGRDESLSVCAPTALATIFEHENSEQRQPEYSHESSVAREGRRQRQCIRTPPRVPFHSPPTHAQFSPRLSDQLRLARLSLIQRSESSPASIHSPAAATALPQSTLTCQSTIAVVVAIPLTVLQLDSIKRLAHHIRHRCSHPTQSASAPP